MDADQYQYKEISLPNYTTGGKGALRSMSNLDAVSSANLGSGWRGSIYDNHFIGVYVTNVTWDSTGGALVVDYSNSSQTTIPFSDCPA